MIVRVTRSRIKGGHEAEVLDVVRRLTGEYGAIPGLCAAMFGRSIAAEGSWLLSITEWESIEAIRAVYGDRWAERSLLPGVEEYILETTLEHYESTLEDVTSVVNERHASTVITAG